MSLFSSIFSGSDLPAAQHIHTALDLATYAAGLASNPADIDPMLDRVRKITATHSVADGLSPEDEATLLSVYQEIEAYLMTRDPIRTYTKEELRSRVPADLLSKLSAREAKGGS